MRAFLPYRERTEAGFTAPWAHIWEDRKARIYASRGWKKPSVEVVIHGTTSFIPIWKGSVSCTQGSEPEEVVLDFSEVPADVIEDMLHAWVWFV